MTTRRNDLERREMTIFFTILAILLLMLAVTACQGDRGLPGVDGARGPKGTPGLSPSVSSRAATPLECINGGIVLTTDNSAAIVCNGATGPQGVAGVDLTPLTVVQLCPGTPSYPSTFIETAICIADRLYGVYSSNGGFLTYLPPGRYRSNAVGSSCDFSVVTECEVTP